MLNGILLRAFLGVFLALKKSRRPKRPLDQEKPRKSHGRAWTKIYLTYKIYTCYNNTEGGAYGLKTAIY